MRDEENRSSPQFTGSTSRRRSLQAGPSLAPQRLNEQQPPSHQVMDETGVYAIPLSRGEPTLSESLWGEDFLAHLPIVIEGPTPVTAVRGEWDRVATFSEQFPGLREEAGECVLSPAMSRAKQRYVRSCCDLIEFWVEGEVVGVFIGNPEDWSTYYCRVIAFSRPGLGRAVMDEFAQRCIFEPLTRLGVQRLTGETAPTNVAMARWFMALGFLPTGQRLTERWGPILHFTKHLQVETKQAFLKRFGPNRVEIANDNHERR